MAVGGPVYTIVFIVADLQKLNQFKYHESISPTDQQACCELCEPVLLFLIICHICTPVAHAPIEHGQSSKNEISVCANNNKSSGFRQPIRRNLA